MSEDRLHPCIDTFNYFGAALENSGGVDYVGNCVFCGKKKHLYVNVKNGLWDCKVCGTNGNHSSLLNQLYKKMLKDTDVEESDVLALENSRGILRSVFDNFGLVHYNGNWHIPIRNAKNNIVDIRKYSSNRLMSAKGVELGLWNLNELAKAPVGSTVWLCEGEWDGMALWWLLNSINPKNKDVVVAVPGAGTLKPAWLESMRGMDVITLYDNDEAGYKGQAKAASKLDGIARKVSHIVWPASSKVGYDTRDFVVDNMEQGISFANTLIKLHSYMRNTTREQQDINAEEEVIEDSITFNQLLDVFEKYMRMTDDLKDALKLCAAVCLSNDVPGDPLWLYIVGAPGFGKTMILGSMTDSERCLLRSTVTAHSFVSGWRGEGTKDPSLIPQLVGKTFVCKDFTEILTMPRTAQDEVFSTLRGAYDGVVQKTFGNGVTREYKDCRFSMLAGVTHSINGHKQSSLGERFLKYQLRRTPGKHTEDVIDAAIDSVGNEAEAEVELRTAFRQFLLKKIDALKLPRLSSEHKARLRALVQFIAFLRAQVERNERTNDLIFRPEPEAGTRLAKQLAKLAMCLSSLRDSDVIADEDYNLVERVALDTAVGFHLDIVDIMAKQGKPLHRQELAQLAQIPYMSMTRHMEDLSLLKVVIETKQNDEKAGRPKSFYHLTPTLEKLWKQAKGMRKTLKLRRSRSS